MSRNDPSLQKILVDTLWHTHSHPLYHNKARGELRDKVKSQLRDKDLDYCLGLFSVGLMEYGIDGVKQYCSIDFITNLSILI